MNLIREIVAGGNPASMFADRWITAAREARRGGESLHLGAPGSNVWAGEAGSRGVGVSEMLLI